MDTREKDYIMKKTPTQQKYIDSQKRSRKAKALAWGEKTATEQYNAFYKGKSSLKDDADRKELNSFMELDNEH